MLGVNMECALRAAQGFVLDFPENLGVARKISFMRPICGAGLYRYRPHPTKKSFENEIECDCWQHGWRLARMGAGLAWARAWDVSAGARDIGVPCSMLCQGQGQRVPTTTKGNGLHPGVLHTPPECCW